MEDKSPIYISLSSRSIRHTFFSSEIINLAIWAFKVFMNVKIIRAQSYAS